MAPVIDITPLHLSISLVFMLAAGASSVWLSLGLGRDLLIGTIRTVSQLYLLGFVLTYVFAHASLWLTALVFLVMVGFATSIIHGRVKERAIRYRTELFVAMLLSYATVSILVTGVIVGAKPWWDPQYFLPLAGMVVGNSMSALAIALERLLTELRNNRDEVEMRLALGATAAEASTPALRAAVQAGMIPSINSLMGVGIVFIPGMMTGQIIAGQDPVQAVPYQILVMFMIVGATCLGTVIVTLLVRKKCFGPAHELVLGRKKT